MSMCICTYNFFKLRIHTYVPENGSDRHMYSAGINPWEMAGTIDVVLNEFNFLKIRTCPT